MFAVPGLLAALLASMLVFGSVAGFLWLYVFGDDPWPAAAGPALIIGFGPTFLALCSAFLSAAYATGRREESSAALNGRHVAMAAGGTALLLLVIALHQLGT